MEIPTKVKERIGIPLRRIDAREALLFWQDEITPRHADVPLTSEGVPVVPVDFEPFTACMVCPDHLFLGHFRDFVNSVLVSLPTPEDRIKLESRLPEQLRGRDRAGQNKLFSRKEVKIYTMTVSQLYIMAPFFVDAFKWVLDGLVAPKAQQDFRTKLYRAMRAFITMFGVIWVRNFENRKERIASALQAYIQAFDDLNHVSDGMAKKCLDSWRKPLNAQAMPPAV